MLAAQATEQALVNTTIAMVISARIEIATLQRRLAIAKANIASRQHTLEIVQQRYQRGLVGPVDVRLARENLETSMADKPSLELSLAKAHNALDVLLGRQPATSPALPETLPELPDLKPVPIGVPAALLDRRPDVMAAEFSLRSSNELIGMSIAQLYPDFTLTAAYGTSADRWRDIWEHFAETYSLLNRMVQPVFRGGQIRAQIDASKARYAELAANYTTTILSAMQEVEDALAGEMYLQEQLEHAQARLVEAKAAEQLSRQRYERGVESILTVLESERRSRIAEETLELLKGQIWTTRVNLHLAVGGDWDGLDQETTDNGSNDEQ
jgi:multidrug efflux system outer membrane protein